MVGRVFAVEQNNRLDYGLSIQSAPVSNSEKTSLILENSAPLKLTEETVLSFDLFIRKEYMFGIIFRMITNTKENIDLVLSVDERTYFPLLIVNERVYTISQDISSGQWIPVSIALSKTKNEILLTYNNDTLKIPHPLTGISDVKISFGACGFESFESTDIASVNIKNIRMFNNGKLNRFWKLNEHLPDAVLDSVANVPAIAIHPVWMIDMHSTWEKIYSEKVPFFTQITFDEKSCFYIVSPDSKSIRSFDVQNKTMQAMDVKSGRMVSSSPNTLLFDSLSNKLISYNLSESLLSEYSFETQSWNSSIKPVSDPYLNNSAVYLPAEHSIFSFGGYGYHKYGHDLIQVFSDGYQKQTELTEVPPRFSASTALVGNTLYIFGGRGSRSGRQEIAPSNYYDLYAVNLTVGQATLLWKSDSIDVDFLPGENMVYDPDKNCFYVFTSQNGGNLLKIEPDKNGFEAMSFPIGEDTDVCYLYTNLYYSKTQQKLYALFYIKKTAAVNEADIFIYSLDYPPTPVRTLSQVVPVANKQQKGRFLFLSGISICLLLMAVVCYKLKYKSKNRSKKTISFPIVPTGTTNVEKKAYYDFSKSSICFLNGFNVIDKEGNSITEQFTPTLKHLLVLLILYTEKDQKGIFGNKLNQLLWYNKDKETTQNSRNVYLSKLRSLLDKVGSAELINKNGFLSIHLDKSIACDYTETMNLFSQLKEDPLKDQNQIDKLLELLSRGVFLPNTEMSWVDSFKSDFSNTTIDILTQLADQKKYQFNDELRLKIANTLFLHDLINEEALYIKCSVFFNAGKKGMAKNIYDNFCKDYYSMLGIDYKYSLIDIINK